MGQQWAWGLILPANHVEHIVFPNCANGAGGQRDSRGHPKGIVGEAKFPKKVTHSQNCRNCCWAVIPSSRELHSSFLNVEKRLGGFALRVDVLLLPIARDLASQAFSKWEVSKVGVFLVRGLQSSSTSRRALHGARAKPCRESQFKQPECVCLFTLVHPKWNFKVTSDPVELAASIREVESPQKDLIS